MTENASEMLVETSVKDEAYVEAIRNTSQKGNRSGVEPTITTITLYIDSTNLAKLFG